MPIIESTIDTASPAFAQNRAQQLALLAQVRQLEAMVRAHSEKARKKFSERGQLPPRDRVDLILDRGAPFIELSTLAGLGMHDDDGKDNVSGGGNIVGIGVVGGVTCVVSASDSAIKGGAATPMGLEKGLRAQEIALNQKLPYLQMVESAGANLLRQSELFIKGGRSFANLARLSAAGIPVISLVHGSSTAGGAYQPGLSDHVIVVRGRSKIFLAGPPLLKAATGEIATDEELGGAEMHYHISGLAEYMAEDDADGIRIAREVMGKLNYAPVARACGAPPRYDSEELLGVVPVDYRKPYDVREVIARIVDDSDFLDFKPAFGPHTVVGRAAIDGHAIGIIGNNGPIDTEGAAKAAQFIQMCAQTGVPLLFLQNTTGYLVGRQAEEDGIVKHGSKMIQAVANAQVPKITLHIGGSFGAGNYGMCGRAFDPDFIFAWPNNRVSVMGGDQAAKVMTIIAEEGARRAGKEVDRATLDAQAKFIVDLYDKESTALFATARLWDDGIIDPRDSRKIVSFCLSICKSGRERRLHPSSFGVARM
ncbi:MAG TPA: carboxyl transferase domain-containing protein [Micropepsaceae bacterium]|nr:carboxyl transferase domain-containing protein [Micropepsaceae bacterium]